MNEALQVEPAALLPSHQKANPVSVVKLALFALRGALLVGGLHLLWALLCLLLGVPYSTWAHQRKCEANLRTIATAMESYQVSHGSYPLNQNQLVPEFLETLPDCPAADAVSYRSSFVPGGALVVECAGHYHAAVGGKPNEPCLRMERP